jgi:molybdenum-dependent DNA-binding transcriptional regulator ModE
MGEARALFGRKLVEAREARKKGSDTKQNNGGGRLIPQAKKWL